MAETIDQMRRRHESEIAVLQENCKHPKSKWSAWIEEQWAPAHGTGYKVKLCRLCGAEVARNPEAESIQKAIATLFHHNPEPFGFPADAGQRYMKGSAKR